MEVISEQQCFGGVQGVYRHPSETTGTPMRFSVYQPPAINRGPVPVLWFLSGLTCTEENFTTKAGAQRHAANHGWLLVVPDTSPRGAGIPGEEEEYDFGTGAGFYVDAARAPWDRNYRMYSYITGELQELVCSKFNVDVHRQAITGHSMGGHGALTIGLKNPEKYRSISAFAPICSPMRCPWGVKALRGYLGDDPSRWEPYDATSLIKQGMGSGEILVDQGTDDDFLAGQLKPELLQSACEEAGQALTLRMQPGYDHSYYFIASFIEEHIAFHARRMTD
ncbi:MAG: S-formylglutathione hydrolase [Gammaproteobacteria bacterium]|nr:S-formylglutathione hydrolase [Gammaproteobacteria bacterium]